MSTTFEYLHTTHARTAVEPLEGVEPVFTIRRAGSSDLAAIAECEAELFIREGAWTLEQYRDELARPGRLLLVLEHTPAGAVHGRSFAGYALGTIRPSGLEIDAVATRPGSRRRGGGAALLEVLLGWAAMHAAPQARLFVRTRNRAAISLYRRFGFEVVASDKDFYDTGVGAFEMVLDLAVRHRH